MKKVKNGTRLTLKSARYLRANSHFSGYICELIGGTKAKSLGEVDADGDVYVMTIESDYYISLYCFEGFKKPLHLKYDDTNITIYGNGKVGWGCTGVPFEMVEKCYKAAVKQRGKK